VTLAAIAKVRPSRQNVLQVTTGWEPLAHKVILKIKDQHVDEINAVTDFALFNK
jgi:hypothetical protein